MKVDNNCLFCKIINGDLQTDILYNDKYTIVIKDIAPKTKIHLLVMPKKHSAQIDDTDEKTLGRLFSTVGKIARENKFTSQGYRVIVNNGENGGQEVKHLHIHILAGEFIGEMVHKGGDI